MRFNNINALRAFAAITVLVYHVIEHTSWTSFPASGPFLTMRIGWIGVDLFFVISGFVITYSALVLYHRDSDAFQGKYWARRLARILPLYLLTGVLWILFLWPSFFQQPVRIWAWQLFSHLFFIHSFSSATHGSIDGSNWSLAPEMQFYVLISLLIWWISVTPGWRIWLYCILISVAWRTLSLVLYGHSGAWELFVHTTQLPGMLDEFGAGIFLAKYVLNLRELQRPSLRRGFIWLISACLVGYCVMHVFWQHAVYWDNPWMIIFWRTSLSAFFLAVLGAAVFLPQIVDTTWMHPVNYLGETSYGIYLWHLFFISFCTQIQSISSVQVLIVTMGLTILVSILSWTYFEHPIMINFRDTDLLRLIGVKKGAESAVSSQP